MLSILFFGQLRERLETDKLSVDITKLAALPTVLALREYLGQSGELWQELLMSGQCLVAVNQTMATDETLLGNDDEVALFPPVTGG
ncbi:MoaD/ThiS family protein [Paraglaciecola sp.]|uniref:MoaD/ThiS family protein n=1 Tax=Paraglaciecola sp. TaxID=1920173 RepID=UPI0030F37E21